MEAEWDPDLEFKLIPITGTDFAISLMTRSVGAQQRAAARGSGNLPAAAESFRVNTDVRLGAMKNGFQKQYGDNYWSKLSDQQRVDYEALRAANSFLTKGEIPPAVVDITIPIKPRVYVPSSSGSLIERDDVFYSGEDGTYRGSNEIFYRDSEGRLRTTKGLLRDGPLEKVPATPKEAPAKEGGSEGDKSVELTGEGEKLLDKTFKTIFSQSKKARSAAFNEAAKEIADAKKLVGSLPPARRVKFLTDIKKIIDAKGGGTKSQRRAEMVRRVGEEIEVLERRAYEKNIVSDIPNKTDADYAVAILSIQDMLNTDTSPHISRPFQTARFR